MWASLLGCVVRNTLHQHPRAALRNALQGHISHALHQNHLSTITCTVLHSSICSEIGSAMASTPPRCCSACGPGVCVCHLSMAMRQRTDTQVRRGMITRIVRHVDALTPQGQVLVPCPECAAAGSPFGCLLTHSLTYLTPAVYHGTVVYLPMISTTGYR